MKSNFEKLTDYLYAECCPYDIELDEFTEEQGCAKGNNTDLQICKECWKSAIAKIIE